MTVIAGYPWFADWGRDSMIALTGLTLLTGRHAEAQDLLGTFLRSLRRGLTPNNFHDDGQGAGYNTVDGALWLAVALERYVTVTGDASFAREALPQLRDLLDWHVRGTDHGIRMDPADGLLLAGEAGVQLTWMDVKIEGWVVTPRHGKPIEVQGLWLAALGAESRLSAALGEEAQFAATLARAGQLRGVLAGRVRGHPGGGRHAGPQPPPERGDRAGTAGHAHQPRAGCRDDRAAGIGTPLPVGLHAVPAGRAVPG